MKLLQLKEREFVAIDKIISIKEYMDETSSCHGGSELLILGGIRIRTKSTVNEIINSLR